MPAISSGSMVRHGTPPARNGVKMDGFYIGVALCGAGGESLALEMVRVLEVVSSMCFLVSGSRHR